MSKIRVLIADDHEILRDGIRMMLEKESDIELVGEASNGREAIDKARELRPDVLIMDISMPEMTGLEAALELKQLGPDTKILVLSMYDNEDYVMKAIEYGAYGFILKGLGREEFIKAVKTVYKGQKFLSAEISGIVVENYLNISRGKPSGSTYTPDKLESSTSDFSDNDYGLTKREKQILSAVIKGKDNKEISEELDISVRTIETHRFNIMKKIGVNNAADMVRVAMQQKIV